MRLGCVCVCACVRVCVRGCVCLCLCTCACLSIASFTNASACQSRTSINDYVTIQLIIVCRTKVYVNYCHR